MKFWKLIKSWILGKGTKLWRMWKPNGCPYWNLSKESWQNTIHYLLIQIQLKLQKLNLLTCFISCVVYLNFALHELQIQKVVGIGKNLNTTINLSLNCLFIWMNALILSWVVCEMVKLECNLIEFLWIVYGYVKFKINFKMLNFICKFWISFGHVEFLYYKHRFFN